MIIQNKHIIVVGLFALVLSQSALNQAEEADLYSLSLQELLNVKVSTGSLFSGLSKDAPSAITIINRETIELSGAKNLATLLEQTVPGLIVMTHSEGNKIGLRGHIAAENYKLLLLVNGRNLTNNVYEGVITEIDQWEMGDIDRVEVVRGPGSVTYGSGAIAGVINIITKTGQDDLPAFSAGVSRNQTYDGDGVNLQFSNKVNDWGMYGFLSYRETDGQRDPKYFKLNPNEPTDIRYVGEGVTALAPAQDFLADTLGRPQIKAHLDLRKGDNFSTWLRYTQSGQVRFFTEKGFDAEGDLKNRNNSQVRSFVFSGDYRLDLADSSALNASLTYGTQEYVRYRYLDQGSINNIKDYAFSQDRLTANVLYDFDPIETLDLIVGYEYSRIEVGAPWGKGRDHLWIREGTHIISSWQSSVYTQDLSMEGRPSPNDFVEVGSGLRFETHTLLLESKYLISDQYSLFYAQRYDISEISDNLFSPRLSLVNSIDNDNTLVATVQRAQRMMPLRAQYLNQKSNNDSELETLDSLELSYTHAGIDNATVNVRAYYNDIRAVGFTGDDLQFLADYELLGLELAATYKKDNLEITFSHAYIDPLDVNFNDELRDGFNRNNISFSDYFYNTRSGIPILLTGYGDGLNNWPKNVSKLSVTKSFMDGRLKAHVNAQIYWDYDGSYDEMKMYQQSYMDFDRSGLSPGDQVAFEEQFQAFQREKSLLEDQNAFERDYNVNASLTYQFKLTSDAGMKVKIFVENIFETSYRYNVSTGSNQTVPERLEFMDKPRMYGASVQVDF